MNSAEALTAFAAEVGEARAGPVAVVGGRTQWDVGRTPPAEDGDQAVTRAVVRKVRAPVGVVDFQPAEMTVRVRAGTTVADLDAALAPHGQTVALPAWPGATVGGVLAVGHSGVRRLGWGPVRDTLLEARVVNADGRLVKAGGPTVKNVSGYDLCRLLVGSLGTVALMAELVLRTRPAPEQSQWYRSLGPEQPEDRPSRPPVVPSAVLAALHRPQAVLYNGANTWVLLEGHGIDVVTEAMLLADLGLSPVPDTERPDLSAFPHRRSVDPAQLADITGALRPGSYVAEAGVGVIHGSDPGPAPKLDAVARNLNERVKAAFDPTGRLNPSRQPWAVD